MKERSGMPYDVVAFSTDEAAMMLSLESEGAFHRLLRHAWINGSIPKEERQLAQICRVITMNQMRRMWEQLSPLWQTHPELSDRLVNPKQESERMFVNAKSDKAAASADKRWKTKKGPDANALRTHSEGNATSVNSSNASPPRPNPTRTGEVKNTSPSPSPQKDAASNRPRDLAFDLFAEAHQQTLDAVYVSKEGDFVMLTKLRKAYKTLNRGSPPQWQDAVQNYFSSPLGNYSLSDLCSRFAVFKNGPVDRFNKLGGILGTAGQQTARNSAELMREMAERSKRDS